MQNLSKQPIPVPHHRLSKEFHPNIQSKSALFQFKIMVPFPVTICPCKKLFFLFFIKPPLSTGTLQLVEITLKFFIKFLQSASCLVS